VRIFSALSGGGRILSSKETAHAPPDAGVAPLRIRFGHAFIVGMYRKRLAGLVALAWFMGVGGACDKTSTTKTNEQQDAGAEAKDGGATDASTATDAAATTTTSTAPTLPPPSPKSLGAPMKVPADNELTAAKVKLGHQLFFDPRMSASGTMSCYSCHQNKDGTGGAVAIAVKDGGKPAGRHAPIMWNVGYLPALYWDGRAQSLEEQGLAAWAGMLGVGKDNLAKKAEEIAAIPGYKKEFERAFPGQTVTPELVIKAIASYERTMVCADTAYDKYQAGDKSAMTKKQIAGYKIFIGKAACTACHTPPFFSDAFNTPGGAYHNVGVGTKGVPKQEVDVGREKVTGIQSQWSAFKTPSLRGVSQSPPYFHNGSAATLKEATELMAKGGLKNEFLDPQLKNRHLTPAELALLLDFLRALKCPGELAVPLLPG